MDPVLPPTNPPNNQPNGKENTGNGKQVNACQSNEAKKSIFAAIFHDDFFRFMTSFSLGLWMIHEIVSDAHNVILYIAIIMGLADGFFVLAHKLLPNRLILKGLMWFIYFFCLVAIFHFKINEESTAYSKLDSVSPVLSIGSARLGDGIHSIKTAFSLYNPSDFAINGVVLKLHINGNGVSADSVAIRLTDEDTYFKDAPADAIGHYSFIVNAYTERFDVMQDATNQNIFYQIGSVRAKAYRFLEICGATNLTCSVDMQVVYYSTNAWEIYQNNNGFGSLYPALPISLKAIAIRNSTTNLVILSRGITNYPVEQNGKWLHYRFGIY